MCVLISFIRIAAVSVYLSLHLFRFPPLSFSSASLCMRVCVRAFWMCSHSSSSVADMLTHAHKPCMADTFNERATYTFRERHERNAKIFRILYIDSQRRTIKWCTIQYEFERKGGEGQRKPYASCVSVCVRACNGVSVFVRVTCKWDAHEFPLASICACECVCVRESVYDCMSDETFTRNNEIEYPWRFSRQWLDSVAQKQAAKTIQGEREKRRRERKKHTYYRTIQGHKFRHPSKGAKGKRREDARHSKSRKTEIKKNPKQALYYVLCTHVHYVCICVRLHHYSVRSQCIAMWNFFREFHTFCVSIFSLVSPFFRCFFCVPSLLPLRNMSE